MSEKRGQFNWGTICSTLAGFLVAIVPIIWQVQKASESRKARETMQTRLRELGEASQKAHKQLYEQQQRQKGVRHDIEIQYPKRQKDPSFIPFHERHGPGPQP